MRQKIVWFLLGLLVASAVFIGSGLTIGEHCKFLTGSDNIGYMISLMDKGWTVERISEVGSTHIICLRHTVLGTLFP